MGAASLFFVYTTSLVVWPGRDGMALAASGLVAFLPQFSFITAGVNNDPMAILLGALCIHRVTRIVQAAENAGRFSYLALGILLGVGLLAKLTLISLLPIAFVLPLLVEKNRRNWVGAWSQMAAGLLATSGWWFVRNLALYGDFLGDHWKINPTYFAWDLAPKSLLSAYFLPQHFWRQTALTQSRQDAERQRRVFPLCGPALQSCSFASLR